MVRKSKLFCHKEEIKNMILSGKTNKEISIYFNVNQSMVQQFVYTNLGGNSNYQKNIIKHKHLRKKILLDRLILSDKEIMEKYNLTKSNLKSCLTAAYKEKSLLSIRKDKRLKTKWSKDDLRFLLQNCGILTYDEINKKLKRGNTGRVVKEKLAQLKIASKNINGLSTHQFKYLFKIKKDPTIKHSKFSLITWVDIDKEIKNGSITHNKVIKMYISTMAMFQRWVYEIQT